MRIKPYYCPHCERFKGSISITHDDWSGMPYCKHCGKGVYNVQRTFELVIKEVIDRTEKGESNG